MKALSDCLVTAIQYIESRSSADPDADVSVLEEMAFILQGASELEKKAFIASAQAQGAIELPRQLGINY